MDAQRKAAYRTIIYWFFVDVRTVPLTDDAQAVEIGRFAGPVAYQLHNLALASAQDFVGFNERDFWASLAAFDQRNPDMLIAAHYQKAFELTLAGN